MIKYLCIHKIYEAGYATFLEINIQLEVEVQNHQLLHLELCVPNKDILQRYSKKIFYKDILQRYSTKIFNFGNTDKRLVFKG